MYGNVIFSPHRPDIANIRKLDHNAMPMVADMHRNGIRIDIPHLHSLTAQINEIQRQCESTVYSSIGSYQYRHSKHGLMPFKISSRDHLSQLLFEELRIQGDDVLEVTPSAKRFEVSEEVLKPYIKSHPCVRPIIEWHSVDKLKTTYTATLPYMVDSDSRLHTRFNYTVAATGRLSSAEPNCFTGDTEVLTQKGWIPFSQYRQSHHLVAQWDNGIISFVVPTGYVKSHNRKIIRLYNEHTDLAVTEDHRCLVFRRRSHEKRVVPAREYPSGHLQLHAGMYDAPGIGLPLTDSEIQLLVALQADGSKTAFGWDVSFKKERKIKRFQSLLEKAPYFRHKQKPRKHGGMRFTLYDKGSRIQQLLGPNKEFGSWVLKFSSHQLEVFAEEVWYWDGCFTRRNHYASKNRTNADWVQTALVLSGRTANIRKYISQGGSISWQVDVIRRDYGLTTNIKKQGMLKQTVYCVSVPSTFLLVRRGGKVSITGNCQNIPSRPKPGSTNPELGKLIRKAFIARPGWRLVSADLSQIEMRWAAYRSQDPVMMAVFLNNEDIHTRTACNVFGLDYNQIMALSQLVDSGNATPEQKAFFKDFKNTKRLPCKTVGFGVLYGQTAQGLMDQLASEEVFWTLEQCEDLIANKFFGVYPKLREMLQEDYTRAYRYGMIWCDFGRPRLVPEAKSQHKRISSEGTRKAGNHPEQSGAQGTLKLAMAALTAICRNLGVLPLLQIHDELIFEAEKSIAGDFADLTRVFMENASPLDGRGGKPVPILSSSDVAETWYDLK